MTNKKKLLWRKLKWRSHVYKRKSEESFLRRIEKTFGPPDKIVIAYGDWCSSYHMRTMAPTLGVGLRRIIARRFKVVLVDEFRTSKLCCHCHRKLSHHHAEGRGKLWRALECQGCLLPKSSSPRYMSRDLNSAINILHLAQYWMQNQERPEEFRRELRG